MPNLATTTLAVTLSCLINAATSQELKGRTWTHADYGIKMTIPKGYATVPLQVDEEWIAAKFLSDKTYLSKSRDWNREHRPLMRIVIFTEDAKKRSTTEVHQTDKATFIGMGTVPYQGYRDYVKRHRRGFFFSKEDEAKVGGIDSLMCEVEVHKGEPKLHLYSVVIRQPTFELAVEFEVLEDRLDKVKADCLRALKSIRIREPAKMISAPITQPNAKRTSTRLWTAFRDEWRKRPSEERDEIRKEMERQHHAATKKSLPSDWTVTESDHFLVISHASPKFTKQMTKGAELFYQWCHKEFGSLGEDYVRRPVLRLCKDRDEYNAFHFGSSNSTGWSFSGEDRELGTYHDNYNGSSGRDVSLLFPGILQHYLQERDPFITSYTPRWLSSALHDYVTECYVKGRKLDFRVEDFERDGARELQREGNLPKLQDLLCMDAESYSKLRSANYEVSYAASQALRYVLGPGSRDKAFKDFLKRYFQTLIAVGEKHDDSKGMTFKSAETEEEEEELAKARAKRFKDRAKTLQRDINQMMFGDVNAKTWAKHEKAFVKFIKKGK